MSDPSVCWRPGSDHGVVWSGGLAILDSTLPVAIANQLWQNLQAGADLPAFFSALSAASGRELLDLPMFAVAVSTADGRAHLAARGSYTAWARGSGGDRSISGEGVITWSETQVDEVSALRLEGPADPGAPVTSPGERVIASGVVPVMILTRTVTIHAAEAPPRMNAVAGELSLPPSEGAGTDPSPAPGVEAQQLDDSLPSEDLTSGEFANLWRDHTLLEPVESAAVRPTVDVPEEPPAHLAAEPVAESVPDASDQATSAPPEETWGESSSSSFSEGVDDGFISSVPKPSGSANEVEPAASPVQAPSGAPVQPPGPPPVEPAGTAETGGEDLDFGDGFTVLELPEMDSGPSVEVLASLCPAGHANPPQRATCRVCRASVSDQPRPVERPALGRLTASTGESVELTGPVIIGRNPTAARFQGSAVPQLLTVPHQHVSANHVEIRLEGWSVLAVDLRSRNGTFLKRHGEKPVRLPESAQLLVSDDILDLGHGLHITFAELP